MKLNKTTMIFGAAGLMVIAALAYGVAKQGGVGPVTPPTLPPTQLPSAPNAKSTVPGTLTLSARLSQSHALAGQALGSAQLLVDVDALDLKNGVAVPLDVAVVIDCSGSMRGDLLENARRAAKALFANLRPGDRATLITYNTNATINVPLIDASQHEGRFDAAMDELLAVGGTNISGGLQTAREVLGASDGVNTRVRRIILLSDGHATNGYTEVSDLARLSNDIRKGGVSVTAMGLGSEFNERAMTRIAAQGGGNYHFIEEGTSLSQTFEREFKNLETSVARGAALRISLANGVTPVQVYGFAHRIEGQQIVVPLSEFFAGQNKSLMVELSVSGTSADRLDVADIQLDYFDLSRRDQATARANLWMATTSVASVAEGSFDREVLIRRQQILTAQTYEAAMERYEAGDNDGARELLQKRSNELQVANRALKSQKLDEEVNVATGALKDVGRYDRSTPKGKAAIKANRARKYKLEISR